MLGPFLSRCVNLWVRLTGRYCAFNAYPWLRGPVAHAPYVGPDFYREYAAEQGLQVAQSTEGGLVADFQAALRPADPNRTRLSPLIADFYEHTSRYRFEVWSEWYPPVSWAARVLIGLVSRKMNQLNIPLRPMETSRGMSNEVLHLVDGETGRLVQACWLRQTRLTKRVVYAGFYSVVEIANQPFVRVVFPLPHGSATVLLRVEVQADGSVKLVSFGNGIGDAGYYRVQQSGPGGVRVKYIPLKEVIHVFVDEENTLRTDHFFSFWRWKFLHLHYKILPVPKRQI